VTLDGKIAESCLYVCDLDGTLLRSDGTLSTFSEDGLNRLLEAGVDLTLASARGTPGMRSLLCGVQFRLPVIELNGAFVSELESGRHLVSNVLSGAEACAAVEVMLETGNDPVISSWDGSRDGVHFGTRTNESTSWYVEEKRRYRDPRLAPCEDLLAVAQAEQIAQITTFALDAEAAALTGRRGGRLRGPPQRPLDVRGRGSQRRTRKCASRCVGKRGGDRRLQRRGRDRSLPAGPPRPLVSRCSTYRVVSEMRGRSG